MAQVTAVGLVGQHAQRNPAGRHRPEELSVKTRPTTVAIRSSVEGIATPDGDAQPMLIEIFRIDDGRLAETWGITEGPGPSIS